MAETKQTNTQIASLNELTSPPRSLFKDAWSRLIRNKGAVVAMVIITSFFVCGLFANKLVPHNPLQMNSGKGFPSPDVGGKRTDRSSGRPILHFWY